MRKYFLPLTICIFLSLVAVYLLRNLNPFNPETLQQLVEGQRIQVQEELIVELQSLAARGLIWEYLSPRNVGLIAMVIGAAAVAGFTFLHLVVDKLFFKQFYQSPDVLTAIRRGAIVILAVVSLLTVRLLAGQWYLYLAVIVVAIALELVAVNVFYREPQVIEVGQKSISTIRLLFSKLKDRVVGFREALRDIYRQQQMLVQDAAGADAPAADDEDFED